MIAASLRWAAHAYHASAEGRSFTDGTVHWPATVWYRQPGTRGSDEASRGRVPGACASDTQCLVTTIDRGTRRTVQGYTLQHRSALILSVVTGTSPTRTCAQYGSPARPRARLYRFFVHNSFLMSETPSYSGLRSRGARGAPLRRPARSSNTSLYRTLTIVVRRATFCRNSRNITQILIYIVE